MACTHLASMHQKKGGEGGTTLNGFIIGLKESEGGVVLRLRRGKVADSAEVFERRRKRTEKSVSPSPQPQEKKHNRTFIFTP